MAQNTTARVPFSVVAMEVRHAHALRINAAIDFARTDSLYRTYRANGWDHSANFRLAERFGEWVAWQARLTLGHVFKG